MSEKTRDELPFIPLTVPELDGNARAYVTECFDTNFVSSVGPFVDRFEREFASYVGARHAVACVNGTAGLHLALVLSGVGPGDEVFVSTFTFIASVNPIKYLGAQPVFVDSEEKTWNLDPELAVGELERRARGGKKMPKALIAVHILGHPAQIHPIAAACDKHGVILIEDAAEALGATYKNGADLGRHVGTIGRIGVFSFNGNKIITTGGGGMLTFDDEKLARRAKHLTTQARVPGFEYWHDEIGFNYRLTNLAAALGVAQLERLPEFLRKKSEIAARYDEALGKIKGITLPPRAQFAEPSRWLYSILIDPLSCGIDRQEMLGRLEAKRIQSRPLWAPIHRQPMYLGAPCLGGKVAEHLFATGLSLPCSVGLGKLEQERVVDCLCESLDHEVSSKCP